ncbi:phosphohydrolase [Streptomonospora alba]|uniref:Phosphohydrolase n=1 Tax=Streptomonospora alba TaxID=183763 RepID=A0A0C2JQA8_9ACTN|nr:HD domain-containing protein [Streptomonospora alba]KIH99007.1 phosphohydrolase [Streptomonospora alba]
MRVPSDDEIRALHAEHAPTREAFDLVYTHCTIVSAIAADLLSRAPTRLDPDLVRAGSMLHDIGVYRLYDRSGRLDYPRYVRHGILGRDLLAEQGYPDALGRFCSCHTGMGITREDVRAQDLPIPQDDYIAESAEEELVMFADKFHSKSRPPILVSPATAAARMRRFGEDKELRFKSLLATYGEPDLSPLHEAHGHEIT